jgi:hypothetical protein
MSTEHAGATVKQGLLHDLQFLSLQMIIVWLVTKNSRWSFIKLLHGTRDVFVRISASNLLVTKLLLAEHFREVSSVRTLSNTLQCIDGPPKHHEVTS